jgi:hypothetical protein
VPQQARMLLFVRSKSIAVAATALIALSCGVSAGLASADPAVPSPAPAPAPAPAPPGPAPKTSIDHDGTFTVGSDIVPGTYTSAGPVGNGVCYWKRLGAGDDGKQLVDNAMSKKPQVVRIEPTDKAFKTDGCQAWQKNDAAVPDPGKSPAEAGVPLNILGSLLGGGGPPPPAPKP